MPPQTEELSLPAPEPKEFKYDKRPLPTSLPIRSHNPHSTMDSGFEDAQSADELMGGNNMVANLPLLFAAGYPTTLSKITDTQLEQFIPFMVQCSLGCIQIYHEFEYSEPEWWPEDVPFVVPLRRPADMLAADWHEKLKAIVIICYTFHKVVYLLRFCDEISKYKPECLRFINNLNTTTSLFERTSNKLLVTFRNENMLYDLKPKSSAKKTLMPRLHSAQLQMDEDSGGSGGGDGGDVGVENHNDESDQHMVQPAPFDIYLCDYCEAELYSMQAFLDHEKICAIDDDVIFCGTEVLPSTSAKSNEQKPNSRHHNHHHPQIDESRSAPPLISDELVRQAQFMNMFGLASESVPVALVAPCPVAETSKKSPSKTSASASSSSAAATSSKLRRMPRRGRAILGLAKCPAIAISSPAGQRLIKTSKSLVSADYLAERLERTERFCHTQLIAAPALSGRKSLAHSLPNGGSNHTNFPYSTSDASTASIPTTFRRPAEYSAHVYTFPRRQYNQRSREERFRCVNSGLMRLCDPMYVPLQMLSVAEVDQLRRDSLRLRPGGRPLTNFQRKQMKRRRKRKESAAAAKRARVVEVIDLCSSGDEAEANEVSDTDTDDTHGENNGVGMAPTSTGNNSPITVVDGVDPLAWVVVGTTVEAYEDQQQQQQQQQGEQQHEHRIGHHSDYNQHHERPEPHSQQTSGDPTTTTSHRYSNAETAALATRLANLSTDVRCNNTPIRPRNSVGIATVHPYHQLLQQQQQEQQQLHRRRRRSSTPVPQEFVIGGSDSSTCNDEHPNDASATIDAHQSPSVCIFSHMTHTSMTLANHKQLYNFTNQENRFTSTASVNNNNINGSSLAGPPPHLLPIQQSPAYINGGGGGGGGFDGLGCAPSSLPIELTPLPTSVTLTATSAASERRASKYLQMAARPEIVLERLPSVLQPQHQQRQQPQQQQLLLLEQPQRLTQQQPISISIDLT